MPALQSAKDLLARIENWCFDASRGIRTRGYEPVDRFTLTGSSQDCLEYLPSRSRTARMALRRLPIHNYGDYTFIDIGSGKGRVLLLAAEYSFRRVQGIEFALELHREAQENISRDRGRRRCAAIQSVHINALDFCFPLDDLVLYLFNPFRESVLNRMLSNVEQSLDEKPRDVFVTIAWPELAPAIRARSRWRTVEENRRFCIYRSSQRGA